MKNKAIEIRDKNFDSLNDYISDYHLKNDILECMTKSMLEFGHYVAEQQKKQCAIESKIITKDRWGDYVFESDYVLTGTDESKAIVSKNSILNSKNVCEQ